MKFSYADLKDSILCEDDYPEKDLEFIRATPWKHTHKMQERQVVFMYDKKYYSMQDYREGNDKKYYSMQDYREGNDFSEWIRLDYLQSIDQDGMVECKEVKQISRMVSSWEDAQYIAKVINESTALLESFPYVEGDCFTNNKTGNRYTLDGVEIHSETLEAMVSYYDDNGKRWTRPMKLFLEKFTKVGDEL